MNLIPRLILAFFFFIPFQFNKPAVSATVPPKPPAPGAVRMQVQNAQFHVLENVMLTVVRLDAWMIPKPGEMVVLDTKNSFVLDIVSGETRLKAQDLTALLNEYLFPHAKAPIRDVTVGFEDGNVVMKGELHKGIDLPFEGKAILSIADPSDLRLRFTDFKVAGVLKKGFLDALGIRLSSVAQPGKESRFHIEGDDIILPIAALFPPPRIAGKVTAARIEGDELVQTFGPADAVMKQPPEAAKNYIYFHGGRMRFGKLTMNDVDLELVDKDPSNDFDFSLDHYYQQLEAGYSKLTPSQGLVSYVVDYSALAKKPQ
jgi:hypothetical protein